MSLRIWSRFFFNIKYKEVIDLRVYPIFFCQDFTCVCPLQSFYANPKCWEWKCTITPASRRGETESTDQLGTGRTEFADSDALLPRLASSPCFFNSTRLMIIPHALGCRCFQREEGRERNIHAREKHQLAAFCMGLHWGLNPRPRDVL